MLTYQTAGEEDAKPLFRLNKQLIDEYEDLDSIDYPKVLQWVSSNISRHISSFSRVMLDGTLVGYYCLLPCEGKMELDSLFVLPQFRGQGIGTQILKKCQAEATVPIFLYVFRRNTRAQALYERMGFQIVKQVGSTRYIMEYQNQSR